MSPRKTILRELARSHAAGTFTRPATISGFERQPEKYQKAVNDLLQARLLEGRRDEEGRMTIALNSARMHEVRRELRPVWARPAVWLALIALLVVVGAGLVV